MKNFLAEAKEKAFDIRHRQTLRYNIGQFEAKFQAMQSQFPDLEKAKRVAKNWRWATLEQLDRYLEDWERNFRARGGQVVWAKDAAEAQDAITQIAAHYNARKVVKSKSMVTEEIDLNAHLERIGLEVLETDLGEYLAQLAGEKPYHITAPILQKSKEQVAQLLHEKFGTSPKFTPEEVMIWVRQKLRFEYEKAEIGITGGNFLVADTGSLLIVENEGNARLCTTLPRVHIAVVGIEKVIASVRQLPVLLPLLATHSTGQRVATYNTLLNGPRQPNEVDGPEAMYVILLDNGRTKALADPKMREILYCIRCGACQNMCPVYRTIGGHAYNATYSGPIGAVLEPLLQGYATQGHLAQASSLCGKCTDVCPVKINLHEMLVQHRENMATAAPDRAEKELWAYWQSAMLRRWTLDLTPKIAKNWAFEHFFAENWGKYHTKIEFPPQSFHQLWKDGKV